VPPLLPRGKQERNLSAYWGRGKAAWVSSLPKACTSRDFIETVWMISSHRSSCPRGARAQDGAIPAAAKERVLSRLSNWGGSLVWLLVC
jgi:hypothetical protein